MICTIDAKTAVVKAEHVFVWISEIKVKTVAKTARVAGHRF